MKPNCVMWIIFVSSKTGTCDCVIRKKKKNWKINAGDISFAPSRFLPSLPPYLPPCFPSCPEVNFALWPSAAAWWPHNPRISWCNPWAKLSQEQSRAFSECSRYGRGSYAMLEICHHRGGLIMTQVHSEKREKDTQIWELKVGRREKEAFVPEKNPCGSYAWPLTVEAFFFSFFCQLGKVQQVPQQDDKQRARFETLG